MFRARLAAAVVCLAALLCLGRPAQGIESSPLRMAPVGGFLEGARPAPSAAGPRLAAQREGALLPRLGEGLSGAWRGLVELFSPRPPARPDASSSVLSSIGGWFGERFQVVRLTLDGAFTISEFQSGSDAGPLEGGRFGGVFAPALRLTEDATLVFVYNGSYNRELQFFTEDEGPRQRNEEQRHEFILMLAKDFLNPLGIQSIKRLTVSPSVFQTYVFTRQTANEEWGDGIPFTSGALSKFKGLYDYWDRGGGLEVRFLFEGPGQRTDVLTFAGQTYLRHYRNFLSLAVIQNRNADEPKFEKDYLGLLGRVVFDHQDPEGLNLRMGYTVLDRRFTEDRADRDPLQLGGRVGENREDITHTFEWRAGHPVRWIRGLFLAVNGSVAYNRSNSGFNDTLPPLPITGAFTDHYYDYMSVRTEPEISLSRRLEGTFFGLPLRGLLTFVTSYSYERRAYRSRKAKDDNGGFRDGGVGDKDETEVDVTHVVWPRLIWQFRKNWILSLEYKRTIARSNFEDQRTFRYEYDINSFGVGVRFRF